MTVADAAEAGLDGARIFHVNVNCSDLERSRAFYVNACGLAEGAHTEPGEPQPGMAFGLDRALWDAWILVGANGFEGGAIDLLEWREPAPTGHAPATIHTAGLQRVGIAVADLDLAIAKVSAHGGTVWSEPNVHHLPNGGEIRIVFASDPDGVAIELIERDASGLSFVGVACTDLQRSVAFYTSLGFRERARFASENETGSHLHVDGPVSMSEVMMSPPAGGAVQLLLVGFDRPGVTPPARRAANEIGMWRVALLLPELERACARLRAAGVELISDPQAMSMGPGLPELRFACFRGPDHEVIELIEQPATA